MEKKTGKVREFCQSRKVGTVIVSRSVTRSKKVFEIVHTSIKFLK